MTRDEIETLSIRWFEKVWNQRDDSAIEEMMATDVIVDGMSQDGERLTGIEHFKIVRQQFLVMFPDIRVTVDETVVEGDTVVNWLTCTATPDRDTFGLDQASKPVQFACVSWGMVKAGKFVSGKNLIDFGAIYRQLED